MLWISLKMEVCLSVCKDDGSIEQKNHRWRMLAGSWSQKVSKTTNLQSIPTSGFLQLIICILKFLLFSTRLNVFISRFWFSFSELWLYFLWFWFRGFFAIEIKKNVSIKSSHLATLTFFQRIVMLFLTTARFQAFYSGHLAIIIFFFDFFSTILSLHLTILIMLVGSWGQKSPKTTILSNITYTAKCKSLKTKISILIQKQAQAIFVLIFSKK